MGKTRETGYLRNILAYDANGLTGYVPNSRTLTINGTTLDLSTNRTFTIATSATLGGLTDATISSLVDNQILKYNAATSKWINWTPNYLTGNQTITVSGDATGSGTTAITLTLANSGVTAGTYNNVTVDAKGRVTSGSNVSYLTGITSSQVTTALGYTPVTTARTITINGTAYDLSADRSWTISGSDSTKMPLAGGTFTGLVTFNFNNTDAVEWPRIRFGASATGWDEGIIKASSAEGVFGRYGMGIHFDSTRAFGIYTSGWTKVMGFKSDQVTSFKALDVPTLALGNSSAYLLSTNVWAGAGGYPGYQFTGGNTRFGFSSTSGYVDVYTDGNFYAGIDLNGSNNLVWHAGNAPRAANSNLMYYAGFTLDANTMPSNSTGFTYAVNAPYTGPIAKFSEDGYPLQLNATYSGGTSIAYRTRNGDAGSWNGWYAFITTANIGSQSVNYASSAGSASTATNTYNINYALGNSHYWTGLQYFQTNNGGYAVNNSNSAALEAYSTGNNSAFMSFHKGGYYAVNMGLDADNVFRIGGWSASGNRLQMDMSGNLTMAGDVTAYSDARVKTNIKTVENALGKVLSLRGVTYTRTDSDDTTTKLGVIAQEVLPIVPEVVNQDNFGTYNVAYGNLSGLFIEAFKDQQKKIESQDKVIEELKAVINGLTK